MSIYEKDVVITAWDFSNNVRCDKFKRGDYLTSGSNESVENQELNKYLSKGGNVKLILLAITIVVVLGLTIYFLYFKEKRKISLKRSRKI